MLLMPSKLSGTPREHRLNTFEVIGGILGDSLERRRQLERRFWGKIQALISGSLSKLHRDGRVLGDLLGELSRSR